MNIKFFLCQIFSTVYIKKPIDYHYLRFCDFFYKINKSLSQITLRRMLDFITW